MRTLLIVLCLVLPAAGHDVISTKITWTKEISRLVYKNCASCHREGGSAFALMTYEQARPWAKAIKEEVLMRRMPPWNAVKGFGEFANDRGLTQEQIELFADWAEGGSPEGDPAFLPPSNLETAAPVVKVGSAKVTVTGGLKLTTGSTFAGIQPGAIPDGGALQVTAALPDGSVEPLLWVQAFHPSYDRPYVFRKPLRLPAGTLIQVSPPTGKVLLFGAAPQGSLDMR